MSRSDVLTEKVLFYLLVALALIAMLFPFYWIVVTSVKAPGEVFRNQFPSLWPQSFWIMSTRFSLKAEGAAPSEAAAANKTLSEVLAANKGVIQYSVDFTNNPGTVEVNFDKRVTKMDDMESAFKSLGYVLVSAEPPQPFNIWTNYKRVNDMQPFGKFLVNSAIVATSTTIFCLLVGALCAYAVARLTFPGRDAVLALILAVSMFPPIAVVSPLFLMLKASGLLNHYAALILPYTAFGLPLTIWTLTSFFRELPRDLEESARVDGCTRFQAFHKIILPLAAPGVFTSAILVFIGAWNEFLFALVFVTKPTMRTVPVGITMYPGQFETPWGTIFAAATLVTLPLVVVVFLFQKRIISGLTAGAVKG